MLSLGPLGEAEVVIEADGAFELAHADLGEGWEVYSVDSTRRFRVPAALGVRPPLQFCCCRLAYGTVAGQAWGNSGSRSGSPSDIVSWCGLGVSARRRKVTPSPQ